MRAQHIWVSGRVQGVFYRAATQAQALSLGLVGWVRNLPDGRVELWVEGESGALEHLLKWCHQGPEQAAVSALEAEEVTPTRQFSVFEVRP